MSVYTNVSREQLKAFLATYSVGFLIDFKGISEGIENTNYFVTTNQGAYVLTLFEQLTQTELPYFLNLMAFIAQHNIASACPIANNQGHYLNELNNKPTALVQRLTGKSIQAGNLTQIAALGRCLGKMHALCLHFNLHRDNQRGPTWWHQTSKLLIPKLSIKEAQLLTSEIKYQNTFKQSKLPTGVTHSDLFRDNVLFDGDKLSGLIDFYYACNDVLLYDVAVTVNDWCNQRESCHLDACKTKTFLTAYHSERPLNDLEHDAWIGMLRAGALRFWISRLQDFHFPKEGEMTHIKDPDVFQYILLNRIEHQQEIIDWWLK